MTCIRGGAGAVWVGSAGCWRRSMASRPAAMPDISSPSCSPNCAVLPCCLPPPPPPPTPCPGPVDGAAVDLHAGGVPPHRLSRHRPTQPVASSRISQPTAVQDGATRSTTGGCVFKGAGGGVTWGGGQRGREEAGGKGHTWELIEGRQRCSTGGLAC
jgi:hypothetical protein